MERMRKSPTMIKPGDRFNRLVAKSYHHTGKHSRRYFIFDCDCGNSKIITAEAAISGNTKSCGCLAREVKRAKRLPGNSGVVNHLVLQYKRHANGRGIKWQLLRDEFESLVRGKCIYCGESHGNMKITKNCREGFAYNGIDRLDPSKPYQIKNCASCCGVCNRAKGVMTYEQFTSWIKKCAKNIKA